MRIRVRIKLFRSLAPDPCYTAISHKTSLAVADRLLVVSRLDYGNATLAGSPSYMFDKLQSVLNVAARLIFSKRRFESVTPLLRDLHWLRVPQRVEYKLSVLVYCCLHNLAPQYLCDELRRVADISSRQRLRSSSTSALIVYRQLCCPLSVIGRFLPLLHASGTVCRFTSLQHHRYRPLGRD